jgi:transcription antitermination factor NusG
MILWAVAAACLVASQEEDNDKREVLLIIRNIMSSLELIKMQLSTRSRKLTERKQSRCTQIKVEIQNNSRSSPKHMRSLVIKIKESSMTKVVSKPFNKVEAEVAMVTSSPKCSVEVDEVVVDNVVQHKEKVFNMPSKLLLKKSIRVRLPKLQ